MWPMQHLCSAKNHLNVALREVTTGNLPAGKNIFVLNTPCVSGVSSGHSGHNVLNSALSLSPVPLGDASLTA